MMKNLIRHGDLLLTPVPVESLPAVEQRKIRENGVVQEGEVTGHMHRVDTALATVFESGYRNDVFIQVGEHGVSIVHDEHKPLELEPNTTYRVTRAREFDYLAHTSRFQAD
jgi:hypothetical protein